jgi:hypothetical protein
MDKNINSALVQDGALTLFSYRIQSEKMALFFYNIFEKLLGQWGGGGIVCQSKSHLNHYFFSNDQAITNFANKTFYKVYKNLQQFGIKSNPNVKF